MNHRTALLLSSAVLLAAACGGDDSATTTTTTATSTTATSATTAVVATTTEPVTTTEAPVTTPAPTTTDAPTTTEAPVEVLRILVSNDDGVDAPGMDAVVRALTALADVEVTVISPLENQSGSGERTSEEPPPVTDEVTLSGYPARAVAGYPADSIVYALGDGVLDEVPHLVVTGLNEGQNMGPIITISGTVGAAIRAVRLGVPALATSQQFADEPDYETGARYVADWVVANRDALLAGELPLQVYNMNVPSCPEGEPRGLLEVPVLDDLDGRDYVAPSNCVGEVDEADNDVDGMQRGWVTLSTFPAPEPDA